MSLLECSGTAQTFKVFLYLIAALGRVPFECVDHPGLARPRIFPSFSQGSVTKQIWCDNDLRTSSLEATLLCCRLIAQQFKNSVTLCVVGGANNKAFDNTVTLFY